jgi:hypothetical protein
MLATGLNPPPTELLLSDAVKHMNLVRQPLHTPRRRQSLSLDLDVKVPLQLQSSESSPEAAGSGANEPRQRRKSRELDGLVKSPDSQEGDAIDTFMKDNTRDKALAALDSASTATPRRTRQSGELAALDGAVSGLTPRRTRHSGELTDGAVHAYRGPYDGSSFELKRGSRLGSMGPVPGAPMGAVAEGAVTKASLETPRRRSDVSPARRETAPADGTLPLSGRAGERAPGKRASGRASRRQSREVECQPRKLSAADQAQASLKAYSDAYAQPWRGGF